MMTVVPARGTPRRSRRGDDSWEKPMRRYCLAILAALAAGLSIAGAQDYPARQVTIIVPFAPGGSADIVPRLYAQKLSERLGKPGVVEEPTRAGTGGGTRTVARAV